MSGCTHFWANLHKAYENLVCPTGPAYQLQLPPTPVDQVLTPGLVYSVVSGGSQDAAGYCIGDNGDQLVVSLDENNTGLFAQFYGAFMIYSADTVPADWPANLQIVINVSGAFLGLISGIGPIGSSDQSDLLASGWTTTQINALRSGAPPALVVADPPGLDLYPGSTITASVQDTDNNPGVVLPGFRVVFVGAIESSGPPQ